MVALMLSSFKGNSTSRFFPHSGYLGITPVHIQGLVRTRKDEDRKPLLASSVTVTVCCYESRIGRLGVTRTNALFETSQTLWTKADGAQWSEIADNDLPFHITLPTDAAGFSSNNFQAYRIFWRIEAALNHMPISGVGNRQFKAFDIALTRFDAGAPLPSLSSPLSANVSDSEVETPWLDSMYNMRYKLRCPNRPVGPQEDIQITCAIHQREPAIAPQRLHLSIERRISLYESTSTATSPSISPTISFSKMFSCSSPSSARASVNNSSPSVSSSEGTFSSSANLIANHRRSPSPLPSSKVMAQQIMAVETPITSPSAESIYSETLSLSLPAPKSTGHWGIGETLQTSLAAVQFFICIKVTVAMPSGALELVPIGEQELAVVPLCEIERQRIIKQLSKHSISPTPPPKPADIQILVPPPIYSEGVPHPPILPPPLTSPRTKPRPPSVGGSGAGSSMTPLSIMTSKIGKRRSHSVSSTREREALIQPSQPLTAALESAGFASRMGQGDVDSEINLDRIGLGTRRRAAAGGVNEDSSGGQPRSKHQKLFGDSPSSPSSLSHAFSAVPVDSPISVPQVPPAAVVLSTSLAPGAGKRSSGTAGTAESGGAGMPMSIPGVKEEDVVEWEAEVEYMGSAKARRAAVKAATLPRSSHGRDDASRGGTPFGGGIIARPLLPDVVV